MQKPVSSALKSGPQREPLSSLLKIVRSLTGKNSLKFSLPYLNATTSYNDLQAETVSKTIRTKPKEDCVGSIHPFSGAPACLFMHYAHRRQQHMQRALSGCERCVCLVLIQCETRRRQNVGPLHAGANDRHEPGQVFPHSSRAIFAHTFQRMGRRADRYAQHPRRSSERRLCMLMPA